MCSWGESNNVLSHVVIEDIVPRINTIQSILSSHECIFTAFVRPETLSSLQSKTDDSDEVFQQDLKYTLKHKAHLSSLLGSSSTEDSDTQLSLFVEFPLLRGKVLESNTKEKPLKATCYVQD